MTLAIKEMVYIPTYIKKREILARGSYKGYEYAVVSYGVHPCAYIAISEGQPYFKVSSYDDVDLSMHGGCTFVDKGLSDVFDNDQTVIGWDYGHYNDFSGTYLLGDINCPLSIEVKKWTTREMMEECRNVIEQLYLLEHLETMYR